MIVITGATGGIGVAVAEALAARGEHLVLTARDRPRLEQLAGSVRDLGGSAVVRPCDLRDQEAVSALAASILAQDGTPSAVISLAGHSIRRDLTATFGRPHDLIRLTGTNMLGPATLILALLEPMCAAGEGRIVAITSAGTRIPTPGWAAYGASKAGLDSWLRSLRPQASARGVGVAIVEMPLVATEMASPTYGSAPRGALAPRGAAALVLRALDSRRSLVSPLWARLGAAASQAAPAVSASIAGEAAHLLERLARRDRARHPHRSPEHR